MSENRDLESRLRAYGKARQDESAPSGQLHPATRRLLQGEVSRVYKMSSSTPSSRPMAWGLTWRRLGTAFTLLLLLSAGAVLLLKLDPPDNTLQMARSSTVLPATESVISPATQPVELSVRPADALSAAEAATPDGTALADSFRRRLESNGAAEDMVKAKLAPGYDSVATEAKTTDPTPTPGRPAAPLPTFNKQRVDRLDLADAPQPPAINTPVRVAADAAGQAAGLKLATRSMPETTISGPTSQASTSATYALSPHTADPRIAFVPPPPASVGRTLATSEGNVSFHGQFRSILTSAGIAGDRPARRATRTENQSTILAGFWFAYTNGAAIVTDHDGSVYSGPAMATLVLATQASAADSRPNEQPRAPAGKVIPAREQAESISFEVAGTNITLNQLVHFNGVVTPVPTTTAAAVNQLSARAERPAAAQADEKTELDAQAQVRRGIAPVRTQPAAPSTTLPTLLPARPPPVQSMQIRGRIQVGTNQAAPMDAVIVSPANK